MKDSTTHANAAAPDALIAFAEALGKIAAKDCMHLLMGTGEKLRQEKEITLGRDDNMGVGGTGGHPKKA